MSDEPTAARESFGDIAPTQLAFDAGWPPAMTALQIARRVFDEQPA